MRKRYRGRGEVLAGIDLDLTSGRPTVVAGGNGAGKSTLLRVVAGVSGPTAGRVTGRSPVVGYLPGRFPAATRMPARAYLRHLAAIHGGARSDTGLLAELGFTGDLDAPMDELSTGDARKVALVQALAADPPLLVLDEPWSNLDAAAAYDHLARRAGAATIKRCGGSRLSLDPSGFPYRGRTIDVDVSSLLNRRR